MAAYAKVAKQKLFLKAVVEAMVPDTMGSY